MSRNQRMKEASELSKVDISQIKTIYQIKCPRGGLLRIEEWPEGLVAWYDGDLIFKSWTSPSIPIRKLLYLTGN